MDDYFLWNVTVNKKKIKDYLAKDVVCTPTNIKGLKLLQVSYDRLNKKYKGQVDSLCQVSFNGEQTDLSPQTHLINAIYNDEIIGCVALLTTPALMEMMKNKGATDLNGYGIKGVGGIFLYNLCVSEKFRKKGIGDLLVKTAIKKCKKHGKKYIYLHVHKDNIASLKIFARYDFRVESEYIDSATNKKVASLFRWID